SDSLSPSSTSVPSPKRERAEIALLSPSSSCDHQMRTASPALAIPTIQTSRAPVHDHQRLGAALVAHGGAGREAGAVAGDFDVFFVVGGRRDGAVPIPAFPRWGGGRSSGYVRVFF